MSVVTFLFLWHRKHIKHLFIVQRRWNVRHQQRTNNNISEKRGLAASVIILIDRTWRSCWVGRNWVGLKNVFVEAKYILTLCPRLTASLFGPLKQQNRVSCLSFKLRLLFQSWKQIWFLGLFQAVNMFLFSGTFLPITTFKMSQHVQATVRGKKPQNKYSLLTNWQNDDLTSLRKLDKNINWLWRLI